MKWANRSIEETNLIYYGFFRSDQIRIRLIGLLFLNHFIGTVIAFSHS